MKQTAGKVNAKYNEDLSLHAKEENRPKYIHASNRKLVLCSVWVFTAAGRQKVSRKTERCCKMS